MSDDPTLENWNVLKFGQRHTEPVTPGLALWFDAEAWNEADIPQRPWIATGYILRGAVTVLAGAGAAGKSMLSLAWSVSLALNIEWGRFRPRHACRVLTVNMEDDRDEQRRRLSAVLRQHDATPKDIAGKVVRAGPNTVGILFESDGFGRLQQTPAMADLEAMIVQTQPDVVFLDPLAELHNVNENDNNAFGAVVAQFRTLAKRHDIAIVLIHHFRKGVGEAGDPDSIRGAAALIGAARVALTVMTMSKEDAEKLGIDDKERRSLFRLDSAKSNYAPLHDVEWFKRTEYQLANTEWIAAAEPWHPPDTFQAMDATACNLALDKIALGPASGGFYTASRAGRTSPNNSRWVGHLLMTQFGLTEGQADRIVKAWLGSGLLFKHTYRDASTRNNTVGVKVDDSMRPG